MPITLYKDTLSLVVWFVLEPGKKFSLEEGGTSYSDSRVRNAGTDSKQSPGYAHTSLSAFLQPQIHKYKYINTNTQIPKQGPGYAPKSFRHKKKLQSWRASTNDIAIIGETHSSKQTQQQRMNETD